nr:recombinase family protein [Thermochromatium tepidum]
MHPNTLRKYADLGIIPSIRNPAGQRLFDVDAYLRRAYPDAEVIQDIGSGLNFKRKGLRALLERLLRGDKLRVVVAHRDRLARFGFDLIAFLVEHNGGEVVVLDQPVDQPREAELTSNLLATLYRNHGRRSHQDQKHPDLPDGGAEKPVSAVARNLKIRLQRDRQASRSAQRGTGGSLDGGVQTDPGQSAGLGQTCPLPDQEDCR